MYRCLLRSYIHEKEKEGRRREERNDKLPVGILCTILSQALMGPGRSRSLILKVFLCGSGWPGTYYATQAGLELMAFLLHQPPKSRDYKNKPSHPTVALDLN